MARPSKYSLEFKQRAVNLVLETRVLDEAPGSATSSVGRDL